jgi:hypothetical protein
MTRREAKSSGSIKSEEGIGRAKILGEGGRTGVWAGLDWEYDAGPILENHGWAMISGI